MPRERPDERQRRRICFVTGTRAEFGLMQSTLRALRDHPNIELQIIATGLHTQRANRPMLNEIRRGGWKIDAIVPWPEDQTPVGIARAMGRATASLAERFERLKADVILVVGDRVEAFAAASAAHVSGRVLAHVHGGDRAMGQVDDALRHAISKLAHIHFAATKESGGRLFAMGEDRKRIYVVGAPGIDGIRDGAATLEARPAALNVLSGDRSIADCAFLLLHPTEANDRAEAKRTRLLLDAVERTFDRNVIALLPNGDPGSQGIASVLRAREKAGRVQLATHIDRPMFLSLLHKCRALIGNSSSGIIEAGSFGTPVLDIGPRQFGRERGPNVVHAEWTEKSIRASMNKIAKQIRTLPADNPYERGGAGRRIARLLGSLDLDGPLRRKVIRY